MSTEDQEIPAFEEYETIYGTVIGHESGHYIVRTSDGRVVGYRASGEPSQDAAEGDIAEAIANPPPPPVPDEISRAEFVIALRKVLGLTEGDIFALISALPKGEEQEDARDLWEHARTFKRNNRFLLALAQIEGVTEAQLDELFRIGASLELD